MTLERFIGTKYDFYAGPLELNDVPEEKIEGMNCQFASLLYYKEVWGIEFKPEDMLSSNAYKRIGVPEGERELLHDYEYVSQLLLPGHLVFALNRKRFPSPPPFEQLDQDEELQKRLHQAPVIGNRDSQVMYAHFSTYRDTIPPSSTEPHAFHACFKKGKKVNAWPLQDIQKYYWIMGVRDPVNSIRYAPFFV